MVRYRISLSSDVETAESQSVATQQGQYEINEKNCLVILYYFFNIFIFNSCTK